MGPLHSPDCAVRVIEWWDACVVYISGAPGYPAFYGMCLDAYPAGCTMLLPAPEHGSDGTCSAGLSLEHSCGCSFECDEGYGLVGAQPYCEQGYLSSTARCALEGCTDSQATNFEESAELDDGSCTYADCVAGDLLPTGGELGSCPGPGGSLAHGEACELTCAANEVLDCDLLLPAGRYRMCGGSCVPHTGCSYVLSGAPEQGLPQATGYVGRRRAARAALDSDWTRHTDAFLAVGYQPSCVSGNINEHVECLPLGCTDSLAVNFASTAVVDDGSCEFTYEALARQFVPAALAEATVMSCGVADIGMADEGLSQANCELAGSCTYVSHVTERCDAADTMTCPRTDISSDSEQESRTACMEAACTRRSGFGFCTYSNCDYIAFEPRVEESCAATHLESCPAADISMYDPAVSESNCLGAGTCTYTAWVQEVLEACLPTFADQCGSADLSVDDWRTDMYYCETLGGCDPSAPCGDDCRYVAADPVANTTEACVPVAAPSCEAVELLPPISTMIDTMSVAEREGIVADRRAACRAAGQSTYGKQVCSYVDYVVPIVETCTTTDAEACESVDISPLNDLADEAASRAACTGAGSCTYTAFFPGVVEECVDKSAEACRAADLSGAESDSRAVCADAGDCIYTAGVEEACPPTSVVAGDVDADLDFVCNLLSPQAFAVAQSEQGWDLVANAGEVEAIRWPPDPPLDPSTIHKNHAVIILADEHRLIQGRSDLTALDGRFTVRARGALWLRHIELRSLEAPHAASASYTGWRGYGGAIHIDSGKVTVDHCLFHSNKALTSGAAIYVIATPVSPNTVDMAYGVAELVVTDSQFVGNSVESKGGAVYVETHCEHCNASARIVRSEFHRNSGQYGGALAAGRGKIDITVEDSLFYENGVAGTLANLAEISNASLTSLVSELKLNAQSEARFVQSFRDLDPLNVLGWQRQSVSSWVTELGLSAKESIIRSYIPQGTVEGGALYFEGRTCEAADTTVCSSTVLDGADDAANRAKCEAMATSPQAASNGNHITCTYTAPVQEVVERCTAVDVDACAAADLSSAVMYVSRAYCLNAGDCEYTEAPETCVATAKDICEAADMGDSRPATGNPQTGDELSCTRTCTTACEESCSTTCVPVSQLRCDEASSDEFGPCAYSTPVVGVAQACVATDTDVCASADISGNWRASQRSCEAQGACRYVSGETQASIIDCSFDDNIAQYGRHLQAYSPGQMLIRGSEILDYDESSVDIVSASEAVPGCRAYPCAPGESCRDEMQSTYCARCPDGTFSSDGIDCTPCPPGFMPSPDQSICQPCPFGLHSPGWGDSCRPCLPGYQPRNRVDQYTYVAGKCLTFSGLPAETGGRPLTEAECVGQRREWVAATCRASNDLHSNGLVVAEGGTEEECTYPSHCEACKWDDHPRENLSALTTQYALFPIIVGGQPANDTYYWSDGRECKRCDPGYEPSDDRSACRVCIDTYSSDGRQCLQCPPGSQPNNATGAATCVTCLSVAPSLASANGSMCITCEAGQQPNPENQTECQECPSGRFSLAGATCEPCDPGHQPNAGKYDCETCASVGLNLHSVAGEPCSACPPGSGPDSLGRGDYTSVYSICEPCGAGYTSRNGQCASCPPGEQPTADQMDCESCMVAEVIVGTPVVPGICSALGPRIAECNGTCVPIPYSCDSWFWSEGHECRRCTPGYQPSPDRSMCLTCVDSASSDGGQCLPCIPGTEPATIEGAASCSNCSLIGPNMASADGHKCISCPAGHQPTLDRSDCEECPAGRSSLTGAKCTDCLPGSAPGATRSTCDLCSAGRFSHDGVACLPFEECGAHFNGSRVPAMVTGRGSSCLNVHGQSRAADDVTSCESEATGYAWTPGIPSECLGADNSTIVYNLLQPACELYQTGHVWDADWIFCREALETVWTPEAPSQCLGIDNTTITYGDLQPACEQSLEGHVWTETCDLMPSTCAQYVPTVAVEFCATTQCVGWQETQHCSSLGARDPDSDEDCSTSISSGRSGYCNCTGGRLVAVDCGHPIWTCAATCAAGASLQPSSGPECSFANVTSGRVWTPPVPASCVIAADNRAISATSATRCYYSGRRVEGPTTPDECLFASTGSRWTAPVAGICTDTVNGQVVVAESRSACEFRPTGYTWADASPLFGGGADTCIPCEPGTELSSFGSRCEKCGAGKHSTNGEDCSDCYAGSEPMRCENTPADWTSAASNASARISSLSCKGYQTLDLCTFDGGYGPGWDPTDGIFSDWSSEGIDATQACCVCGGGRPTPGPSVCLNCSSVGPSMVSRDGTTCVSCPAGFQPTQYREDCMECPPGRASLDGAECIECLPGTAPISSRSSCEECGAGRFSHDGVACLPFDQCGAHFDDTHIPAALAASAQCLQCPDGTERSADGVYCGACPEGRHSMGGDDCVDCPAGKISTPHRHNCSFCPEPGSEPNRPSGAGYCVTCGFGKYSSGYGRFCEDCWAHSQSTADRSSCDCDSGWRSAGTVVSTFTGGDAGEGLDLSGQFLFAVDIRGPGGVSARDATFTTDSAPGVTVVAQRNVLNWGPANRFGSSQADDALEVVTKAIRFSSTRDYDTSMHPHPVQITLSNLEPKTRYRLQLIFCDKMDQMGMDREIGFDVIVDGNVVADDFSPLQTHGARAVTKAAVVTVDMLSNGDSVLIELGGETSFADGTNPIIQALTLEQGVLDEGASEGRLALDQLGLDAVADSVHPVTGWRQDMTVMCVDTDECAVNNGGCDVLTECTNGFGSRICAPCPVGFLDSPSRDFTATTGNVTCVPKAVTGSSQKAPLREVTLDMEADPDELGDPPHTEYMTKVAAQLAASLGLNASEVQLTSIATGAAGRRLQSTSTISISFVILAEDEGAALADLNAQLADPSSPLLNITSVVPGQGAFDRIGVGCPAGMVIDPVDEVCTACSRGQQVDRDIGPTGACVDCAVGYMGDGFQCVFCKAGSEPSFRDRTRGGDPWPADPDATPAATDCRTCAEIGPTYATDFYSDRLATPSKSFCFECPPGSAPDTNRSDCVMCADLGPDMASNGEECAPCLAGQMPNRQRSTCLDCPPGAASNGTVCIPCPPGYEGGNGTYSECAMCDEDEYSEEFASESCTVCPSKSDTRGLVAQGSAAACLCSGNPDNPIGGSYSASLFFADGEDYSESLVEDLFEHEPSLVAMTGVAGRPVEVLSCWKDGAWEASADASRAASYDCVVCPPCFNCSAGTASEPFTAPGYWRESPASPRAHKCRYRYGCLGGRESRCNVSYTGALCASCDTGYTPTETECWTCPHGFFSFLFAAGVGVAFFSMGIYIIGQNSEAMKTWTRADVIRHGPKEPELITVAARTLYAFLTVQSLTGDFRLNWPTFVVQVNEIQAMVAQPSMLMMFLACIKAPKPEGALEEEEDVPWAYVRAIYMLVLMPLFCIFGPMVYFFCLHVLSLVKKMGGGMSRENLSKSMRDMKHAGGAKEAKSLYADKYFSSVVILLFVLHPSLVRETLYLFPCQTLEDGLSVLRANPGIVCGTAQHWSMMVFVATPSFVFWCAGLPGFAMYKLYKFSRTHSNGIVDLDAQFNEMVELKSEEATRLDDEDVQRRWGFLYRGYERQYFWWELVVTGRKVGMVLIAVMLEEWGPGVQALAAISMIQICMIVHARKEPFSYANQDGLETQSLACSFVCLLGGMVFWTQDVEDTTDLEEGGIDLASLILTLSIVVLNVTVFITVLQQVLVSQFAAFYAWAHEKYAAYQAKRLEEKGQGKHLGIWYHVKATFRKIPGCKQKGKVYTASEERSIKIAKNAADKQKREQAVAGASELERLQRKAEAMYRILWHVSKFKKQLEELKDDERGLPELESDVDDVSDWLDRLADTVLQEKTKTQYIREEVTADIIAKVAYWAAHELPKEVPLRPKSPDPEPEPPLTIEDLEEIWAETSRGVQTESDFSNDAALLAALEADVKLRWAPGALDAGRGSVQRKKRAA